MDTVVRITWFEFLSCYQSGVDVPPCCASFQPRRGKKTERNVITTMAIAIKGMARRTLRMISGTRISMPQLFLRSSMNQRVRARVMRAFHGSALRKSEKGFSSAVASLSLALLEESRPEDPAPPRESPDGSPPDFPGMTISSISMVLGSGMGGVSVWLCLMQCFFRISFDDGEALTMKCRIRPECEASAMRAL